MQAKRFIASSNKCSLKTQKMSEKAVVMFSASVNPEGKEALGAYLSKAQPMTAAAGGVTTVTYSVTENFTSANAPQMVVMVEFPSAEAARNLYHSEEYKALIPDRDKGLTNLNIYMVQPK